MSAKGSELKRVRQSIKSKDRNKAYNSKINTVIRKVKSTSKKEEALTALNDAIKTIDNYEQGVSSHKLNTSIISLINADRYIYEKKLYFRNFTGDGR